MIIIKYVDFMYIVCETLNVYLYVKVNIISSFVAIC